VAEDGVVIVCDWAPPSLHEYHSYWHPEPQLTGLLAAIVCVEPETQVNVCGVVIGELSTVTKPEPVGLEVTVIETLLEQSQDEPAYACITNFDPSQYAIVPESPIIQ